MTLEWQNRGGLKPKPSLLCFLWSLQQGPLSFGHLAPCTHLLLKSVPIIFSWLSLETVITPL